MAHKYHNTEHTIGETSAITSTVILEKIMSPNEIYAMCASASKNGITAAGFAAFDNAMNTVQKRYFDRGVSVLIDDVLKTAIGVRGSFASLSGPWNPLMNKLVPSAASRGELKNYPETNKGLMTPMNVVQGLTPYINTVYDQITDLYDVATGTNPLTIGGTNLVPNTEADDEGVWFVLGGTEYKCTITKSEALVVIAALPANAPAGAGKLLMRTRCGQDETMGVSEVYRNVSHVAAA